jgi:WD40 repeat protein
MTLAVGLFALLSWLATPWLWWHSSRPLPRATVLRQVNAGTTQFFTSGAQLLICGDKQQIRVYDVKRGEQVATWSRSIHAMAASYGSPESSALVAFYAGATVEVFDLLSGKSVASFVPGPGSPLRVYLAPNGKLAVTDHDNQTIRAWNLQTGTLVAEFKLPKSSTGHVAFSPDSSHLAVTAPGGPVRLIDLVMREVKVCPCSVNRPMSTAVFTPDGRLVGVARMNPVDLGVWDLTNDQLLVRCPRASSGFLGGGSYCYVNHYPFMPLSSIAGQIGAARASRLFLDIRPERQIFDTGTGRVVACIPQAISAMTADGKTLATFSPEEDCVHLWDVPPRTVVHPLLPWGMLGLALVLTPWWWQLRRRKR